METVWIHRRKAITYLDLSELIEKQDTICQTALGYLKDEYPTYSDHTGECFRDLKLILNAIFKDVIDNVSANTINAGLRYIYRSAPLFKRQHHIVNSAVNNLRKILFEHLNHQPELRSIINNKINLFLEIVNDDTMVTVKIWDYGARILPLSALVLVFFLKFIGLESVYHNLLIMSAWMFFTCGLIWWWWALRKIGMIYITSKKSQTRFQEIQLEIKVLQENLKEFKNSTRCVDKSK